MENNFDTVSGTVRELQKKGYTLDFSILADKECLICNKTSIELSPDEFVIDQIFRFEGDSDPGDEMIVYAISAKDKNAKGVLVNAFGTYSDSRNSAIVKKLNRIKK